jgi:signal transduction histidine kinase
VENLRQKFSAYFKPPNHGNLSLRTKVSLIILFPFVAGLITSTLLETKRHRERELASMSLLASQTGQIIERTLQKDMLTSDFDSIQSTFDEIGKDDRVRALLLLDPNGKVIFAPNHSGVNEVISNQDPSCLPCHSLLPGNRPSGVVVTNTAGQRVFRSMHPIENQAQCTRCHDAQDDILGLLLTDFSIAPVEDALNNDAFASIGWWIAMGLISVLLVNLGMNRLVIRRLEKVASAMGDYAERQEHTVLQETPADEIGLLSASYNSMVKTIQDHEDENEGLSEELQLRIQEREELLRRLIMGQEQERRRVAHELHDDLGQQLSSISLNLELVQRQYLSQNIGAQEQLSNVQELIAEATDRMHDMIYGLRPSVLDDLGLVPAIKNLCYRSLEPANIDYVIEFDGLVERLPQRVETALFRIGQEAINNVIRHSNAQHVMIRFSCHGGWIEAEIHDDGTGFDHPQQKFKASRSSGLGIMGMKERAELEQGDFTIISSPSNGTLIRVRIPIEGQDNNEED